MPVYEYHCDKCDREVTLTLSIREHEKGEIKCPKMRRRIPSATSQRLHVSDIEEILIPNLADPGRRYASVPRRTSRQWRSSEAQRSRRRYASREP